MPADDLYWSPVEIDSEESNNFYKSYIDPWDLENYAYMRQHLDSLDLSSDRSNTRQQLESTSTFSYVPGDRRVSVDKYGSVMNSEHTATSNYAAIDEIDIRGEGYYKSRIGKAVPYGRRNYRDSEEYMYNDEDTMRYLYERKREQNRIPTAKIRRRRSYSYNHGDYEYEPVSSSYEIYSRLEDTRPSVGETTSPIYDDIRSPTPTPTNFGLSTYGHLKIDYSYSWNNLNNYIYN